MSSVVEIERAIAKLSREQFVELGRWFDAERQRKWDEQMDDDAQSGKLHEAYDRLQDENRGHAAIPLNDFLDSEKLS